MTFDLTLDGRPHPLASATPRQLRLALIEGALRFGREAESAWVEGRQDAAADALGRCRRIVSELLRSVPADRSPLWRQVGSIYLFLFEELVDVQLKRDRVKLGKLLTVLAEERETWRQVCGSQEVESSTNCTARVCR